ncbi:MAG TPA: hypothetical protein VFR49_10770 [Solirubrobacteraceae bacterium]|nr:hypothetical protein [Solirubrobacteraceae bacterium]
MRADRSLIPGLGAAVSLVAAVACAFFVTAALVAFHRWPQVAAPGSARALIVASNHKPGRPILVSPTARPPGPAPRPATPRAATAPTARAPISAVVVPTARPRVSSGTPVVQPTPPVGPRQQTPTTTTATGTTPQLPVALATTTQNTTANVSGVVNGLTNGLATTVAPVSPQLAGTVQNLGNSLSGAVVSVGNSLAQLLLGLPSK